MRPKLRVVPWVITLAVVAVAAPEAAAQAARVSVVVKDVDGRPLEGVTVTVTCAARTDYQIVKTTNAKGSVAVTHLDSLQTYSYRFAKEGFQTLTREVRPDYTQITKLEVVLPPEQLAEVPVGEPPAVSGGGRAVAAFNEGAEAQQRGDLELAEKKFRQAAELTPNAAEPHIALSVVANLRGDYATAAAEAEAALAISPTNAQALGLRYDAYRLQGNTEKAAEAAEALRASGAAGVAAGEIFAEGLEEYRAGNTDKAIAKFHQAIGLDPGQVNSYLMLATISLTQGDPAQADALAGKALEIEPGNTNALKVRYDAAQRLGDPAAARAALDALIAADPEWASTDLFNHAVELYNADDMANAAAALEKEVELRPDDARAHFLLGMAKYNLGETDDARTHLTRFLELAPDDPDAALAREMLAYTGK